MISGGGSVTKSSTTASMEGELLLHGNGAGRREHSIRMDGQSAVIETRLKR